MAMRKVLSWGTLLVLVAALTGVGGRTVAGAPHGARATQTGTSAAAVPVTVPTAAVTARAPRQGPIRDEADALARGSDRPQVTAITAARAKRVLAGDWYENLDGPGSGIAPGQRRASDAAVWLVAVEAQVRPMFDRGGPSYPWGVEVFDEANGDLLMDAAVRVQWPSWFEDILEAPG